MTEHKKLSLKLNGKQTVKLKSGSIKFKNYQKKLGVPFKSYDDFECTVRKVKSSDKNSDRVDNGSYTEKY